VTHPGTGHNDLRLQAVQLGATRLQAVTDAASLAAQADAAQVTADQAAAIGDRTAYAAALATSSDLHQARRDRLGSISAVDSDLAGLLHALTGDPCDLEADVPLALLPVRLETRYSPDKTLLLVRIFPDDVHLDRLDRGLSEQERTAGITYWTAIWDGQVTQPQAWQQLVANVHSARAEYVAFAVTPDLSQRQQPPVFPTTLPRQQRAPVARCLPDRFVVRIVQGGHVGSASGKPVPPELVVGLPPGSDPDQLIKVTDKKLVLGPGMEWLVDPAAARDVGMLVEVPLPLPGQDVDQVLAFGVRSALGPAAAAQELVTLLEAHRYADGAAFASPGTPTNNTETDRAAWTRRPDPVPPATTSTTVDPRSEGARTAAAFGLPAAALLSWPGALGDSEALAEAANTTLWQSAWGTFLDRLDGGLGPAVSDGQRESWRDWWQQDVRGGGALPTLRVGNQPYGLLPVGVVGDGWQANGFEQSLVNVLAAARPLAAASVDAVPRVGTGAIDDALIEILGSAPQLLSLRVRSLVSEALVSHLGNLYGIELVQSNQAAQDALAAALWSHLGHEQIRIRGSVGKLTRPLGLPLVSDDEAHGDRAFLTALLNDQLRTVTTVLQALLEIGLGREKDAVTAAAPPDLAHQLVLDSTAQAGDLADLVESTFAQADPDPLRLHQLADQLGERFGVTGAATLALQQPVLAVRTSLANAALQLPAQGAGAQYLSVLGAYFRAQARLAEWKAAAARLITADLEQRRIAVAESLDCASHRYDAWVSSVPAARIRQLRAGQPEGVLLGAYGWVEGLKPDVATARTGGYLHAPSLTHAATAGVLRSGYLTHNPDASGTSALSIDLSSRRVRRAMDLLDGVRQGQSLGALLGYLLERRLHEESLDIYTLSLRALAPCAAGQLVARADVPPPAAQEALAATGVVDGVRLLHLDQQAIWDKLEVAPADNPYLSGAGVWPDLATHKAALEALLAEVADANDAVSDLLLAESVHHLVQGNTARAAATMDAASGGDAPPVDPDVVRTPTRAAALTHRVLLLLDGTDPGTGGWSAGTARAKAEPRLAAWAEARLGPAHQIVVKVAADGTRSTLDALGLSALDLVAGAGQLEARLGAPLAAERDPAWPAGLRAIGEVAVVAASLQRLIAGATELTPASFARGNDQPMRIRVAPDISAWAGIVSSLRAAVAAVEASQPDAVAGLWEFGIGFPAAASAAALAEGRKRRDSAEQLLTRGIGDDAAVGALAEAVFGPGFPVLASVTGGVDLFAQTFGQLTPGRAPIRRWLRDLATVRPGIARYAETLLFGDATVGSRNLAVAQLAVVGTAGVEGWLGQGLTDGSASPDKPVTAVLVDAPAGYDPAATVAGLVLDEWGEQLPRRDTDGAVLQTTGVAVNASAPAARAPQAILLAVTPDNGRWTSDRLAAVLQETRALAGIRGITLQKLALPSPLLPAIQTQSWSLQGDSVLDLTRLVTEIADVRHALAFVKETGP